MLKAGPTVRLFLIQVSTTAVICVFIETKYEKKLINLIKKLTHTRKKY